MAKSKYITMRIDPENHAYLKAMAARDRRSVSNLLSVVIEAAIKRDKTQVEQGSRRRS